MRDPYQVLGVAKSASAKDIKSAFRKLAKKHHPDQNPSDATAQDKFAEVNQAYEIVGDEKQRGAFDRGEIGADGKPKFQNFEAGGDPFGRRQHSGPGAANFEFRSSGRPGGDPSDGAADIFSQLFGDSFAQQARGGRGAHRPQKGADMNATLDVTVEEVAIAAKVNAMMPDGRKIAVKMPAYVEDGQTIRLRGQGEQIPLGEPGDALVQIRIRKHPRYRIEGRDLHVDVAVPLQDAVLGAKVAVETPAGKLALTVPAWSSSDKVLRLKGRGLPQKAGGHGDLYAHLRIMLPEGGSDELAELMRKAG